MTLFNISALFISALVAGAINSVAGGGTFLTFPALIMGGFTPLSANIMSTIALWPGSVSSVLAYRHELDIDRRRLTQFLIMSILGSVVGTTTLLNTPEQTFSRLVPWLLLGATLIFAFGRHGIAFFHRLADEKSGKRHMAALALQFAIGIYGGYFGAGIGILMLAMLQIMGLSDIHKMNALKTVLGGAINAVAVAIFLFSGRIVWPVATIMIIGAIAGGYFGARTALRFPPKTVRWLVSAIGFTMTAYFFVKGA